MEKDREASTGTGTSEGAAVDGTVAIAISIAR